MPLTNTFNHVPPNAIIMWFGSVANVPSGWWLCDGTNGTPDLRGKFIRCASGEQGATGGAAAHVPTGTISAVSGGTPAGSNSTPTFTGTGATITHSGTAVADHASHTHSVTSNVAVANHAFTQPTVSWPAGVPTNANESTHTHGGPTVSWPAGVPTHSGTAISDHASHTHTYTDIVNHVHPDTAVLNMQGGTTPATTGTHVCNSTATGGSVRAITAGDAIAVTAVNPTGGIATGTTNGPGATLTHTVSNQGTIAWPAGVPTNGSTGAGAAHTHTVSWPAGVPTNASGAVDAHGVTNNAVTSAGPSATLTHSVTQPSDHSYTPAGTNSTPTFTGSALGTHSHTFTGDSQNHEPPYYELVFIMKA